MRNTNKCLLLYSGGLDSTTLLYWLVKEKGYNVNAVTLLYGQKHMKEVIFAKKNIEKVKNATHHILDISEISKFLKNGSTLIMGGKEVPKLEQISSEDKIQPPTYVPNRNMIFLSIAIGIAESMEIGEVYYSAQAQDEYGYWDCTEEFVKRINQVVELNRKNTIKIYAPFLNLSKSEIIKLGMNLGVDYSLTWSCYRGDEKPCGVCPTCVERLKAFSKLGLQDPLEYETLS
ncbi:MAG: 7-cyano-7-deazaguanine synthase QueC [Candidatus Hydrogenedentes bacterium]|nr:7-cyano-7-deazaguanine synthase QueC [Candidatus Hydrogenedentota bacterium]